MAQNTVLDWDFQTKHVQPLGVFSGANYLSSESIVMCAVPWLKEDGEYSPDLTPSN